MLLILDDAWNLADAFAFQIGGEQCTHLLTTRFPALAAAFAREQVCCLEQLEDEESIVLLENLAPSVKKYVSIAQLRELARVAGGLPLALVLIGSFLQVQAQSGQPRRVQRALSHILQDVSARLSLAQPQVPWASTSSLPASVNLSLQATIQMSVHQLPALVQTALLALSVFPPKPASFSEEAALAAYNAQGEVLDMLMDSGLLETHQPGRYHLHQTVVDYARSIYTDHEAENRLVQFVVELVSTHQSDYALLEQEVQIIIAALDLAWSASQAGQQQMQIAFTRGMLAFMPFVTAKRLYTVADRLLPCVRQSADSLGDQESVAWSWFHQGQMAELRSDFPQAGNYYLQGLAVAREYNHPLLMGQLLVLLGGAICDGGNYEQARSYTQEGLSVAMELGDQGTCCLALKNLF